MWNQETKVIGVFTPAPTPGLKRLLTSLSYNFAIRFEYRQQQDYSGLDALLLLGTDRSDAESAIQTGLSCYVELVPRHSSGPGICGDTVEFARNNQTPQPFAGRLLQLLEASEAADVRPSGRESVVASVAGCPVWSQWTHATVRASFVSLRLPELRDGEFLFHHLNQHKFLNLLPLIDFIKFVSDDPSWISPPHRACLMFDDPNLHWKSYGFIDFAKLARHAAEHHYHAAIATIPLDGWLVCPSVARLFRDRREQLSLLIHGNNHIKRELARPYSKEDVLFLLSQALGRIEKLERRAGLRVSRVMAAPHGACAEAVMIEMRNVGFEAACISHGSLRAHNSDKQWLDHLGLGMANVVRGFPIMPRFRMSAHCQNDIYLAAYLNQAIIPVGHHEEAASNMELLAQVANTINSLGEVRWTTAGNLSQANYRMRLRDKCLEVRMDSQKVNLTVPGAVAEIYVHGPCLKGLESGHTRALTLRHESGLSRDLLNDEPTALPLRSGERIQLSCIARCSPTVSMRARQPIQLRPFVRRQIAELRDRLKPFLPR